MKRSALRSRRLARLRCPRCFRQRGKKFVTLHCRVFIGNQPPSLCLSPFTILHSVPRLSPQIQLRGAVSATDLNDPLGPNGPDSALRTSDLPVFARSFSEIGDEDCAPATGTFSGNSQTSDDSSGSFQTCYTVFSIDDNGTYDCWTQSRYYCGSWRRCTPSPDGQVYAANTQSSCGGPCQQVVNIGIDCNR